MNERIQELAREAAGGFLSFSEDGFRLSEKEAVKFAELIVKDCVGVVENLPPGYIDYRNQIEDAFRRDCIEKMKRHFGVEE